MRNGFLYEHLFNHANNTNFTPYQANNNVTRFILNDTEINTALPSGTTVLDFIRYERRLTGTKIGCREGDCGACTILVGELNSDKVEYHSVTSCLMPLGNAEGKHLVTIEGINGKALNPVQQAMSDEGATQCGFCTPGFVVSLTGFCLQDKYPDPITSIDGNICRCTGYKSIQRAAHRIVNLCSNRGSLNPVEHAVNAAVVPEYFKGIKLRLQAMRTERGNKTLSAGKGIIVGGGTDLYVQKHEEMVHAQSEYIRLNAELKSIKKEDTVCIVGASTTVTEMIQSEIIRSCFPKFEKYTKLISSTPIRNMATLGGNIVNASPIADFTIFFLALNAKIKLAGKNPARELLLQDFYTGYKTLNKLPEEWIESVSFLIPGKETLFNFEKVSKRTNLDIASVNSAIRIEIDQNIIRRVTISAGGVGPVPLVLNSTAAFLTGKTISEALVDQACDLVDKDISPISDARGTAGYKRFLLKQLIRAHFITLFPSLRLDNFIMSYEEY